jgi:hypothetical protein
MIHDSPSLLVSLGLPGAGGSGQCASRATKAEHADEASSRSAASAPNEDELGIVGTVVDRSALMVSAAP